MGFQFPPHDHDHGACMSDALARAKARCLELGVKWTALREDVFRHIALNHKPVSAYHLIESLGHEGRRLAPVSIYRILDVLQAAGLVHRLESRNAFFACMTDHDGVERTIALLCDDCERVTEAAAPEAFNSIGATVAASGFHAHSAVVEVSGVCAECYGAKARGGAC